ncbi:hypothetical protein B9Z55_007644 [Caenorhabditis nigoni]|nr:hypothetical protein B9Z55_007644 [Caenorhabditis nigoni]
MHLKNDKPSVQVFEISSSNDSWRTDLRCETAKIRSLYPKPFSDPLDLQAILEGNEADEVKENQRNETRFGNMARYGNKATDSTRKRRSAGEKEDKKKPKTSHEKSHERSSLSTRSVRHQSEAPPITIITIYHRHQSIVATNQHQKRRFRFLLFLAILFSQPSHFLPISSSFDLFHPMTMSTKNPYVQFMHNDYFTHHFYHKKKVEEPVINEIFDVYGPALKPAGVVLGKIGFVVFFNWIQKFFFGIFSLFSMFIFPFYYRVFKKNRGNDKNDNFEVLEIFMPNNTSESIDAYDTINMKFYIYLESISILSTFLYIPIFISVTNKTHISVIKSKPERYICYQALFLCLSKITTIILLVYIAFVGYEQIGELRLVSLL